MAEKLNLNSGCRGNAGLDGRIQILFSRHEYSSPQGRLSYNNKPLKAIIWRFVYSAIIYVRNTTGSSMAKGLIYTKDFLFSKKRNSFAITKFVVSGF